MQFKQRLGYYLGGFSIGLIFLAFFLSGKRTSCAYGPEARVLKNINSKPFKVTSEAENQLHAFLIDNTTLKNSLITGDVKFSLSDTKRDSCKLYVIQDEIDDVLFQFTIQNCDSVATLNKVNKR